MASTPTTHPGRPSGATLALLALATLATLWLALLDWRGGASPGVPFVRSEADDVPPAGAPMPADARTERGGTPSELGR